jgi:glycine/D-amino acid oxidase-like deaminating enzyme
MEKEDVEQTLTHYGLDDNLEENWQAFSVPWAQLVQRMANQIGRGHIATGSSVTRISRDGPRWIVWTGREQYRCKQVILAIPNRTIRRFFPTYVRIPDQPFLRTYVQFDQASSRIMAAHIHGTTRMSNELQKIIPMSKERGIYMIAYSDNANALRGKQFTRSDILECLRQEFSIHQPLRILRLKHYFWDVGTHYYEPLSSDFPSRAEFLRYARHPEPGLYVIGESVSLNQGWVEGAFESVWESLKNI